MTDREKCESCIHAKPFGGANDNRCGAWDCDYINRKEAIEVYKAYKDILKENDMGEPIYVETWGVISNMGNRLDIAYTRSLCPTVEATDIFRRSMAETHRCVLLKLLRTRKIELEGE